MADGTAGPPPEVAAEESEERIPLWQRLLDNVWLLMALGLLIPILSYLVWGLADLIGVPTLR